MRQATTMGLDMTRDEFVAKLRASVPDAAGQGAWVVTFSRE